MTAVQEIINVLDPDQIQCHECKKYYHIDGEDIYEDYELPGAHGRPICSQCIKFKQSWNKKDKNPIVNRRIKRNECM